MGKEKENEQVKMKKTSKDYKFDDIEELRKAKDRLEKIYKSIGDGIIRE